MPFTISGSGDVVAVAVSETVDVETDLTAVEAQFATDAAAAQAALASTEASIVSDLKDLAAKHPEITSLTFSGSSSSTDVVAELKADAAPAAEAAPADETAAV